MKNKDEVRLRDALVRNIEAQLDADAKEFGWDFEAATGGESWRSGVATMKQPSAVWGPFIKRLVIGEALRVRHSLERVAVRCESPIEELMLLALVAAAGSYGADDGGLPQMDGRDPEPFCSNRVCVFPQYEVGKYRVDFYVAVCKNDYADKDGRPTDYIWQKGVTLVEVDGHDFHEKTKEQASRDKKRDRILQAAGFQVFRFTGSDVWNRSIECANEVLAAASTRADESRPESTPIKEG